MDRLLPEPDATTADRERREALVRRELIARRRALLAGSGLFDPDWYVRHHPPARHSDLDPLEHYLALGVRARAAPGPLFDVDDYLRQAWHLRPGVDDPLTHYLQRGIAEGRQPISVRAGPPWEPFGRPVERLVSLPAPTRRPTVAVAVHVFYVELFGEICAALAMLPYRFSLLVTTDEPEKAERIEAGFASHGLDASLLVQVHENRGRNFGPFLVGLRHAVRAHDLVLHLHTKKSLHRGAELAAWREVLLRTLLPARPVVSGLIQRFVDDPALGVLTASPGEEMRYWGYHWLSNRHLAQPLFDRLGLRSAVPEGMLDYPVGGMFWARTKAIAPLLDHTWTIEDFPPELGQTDGTIMHAVERVIVLAAQEEGYGFTELDYERGLCRPGWSSRNLDQYRRASHAGLLDTIGQVDTVSFDVFDTLLTRICLRPDAVHRFVGLQAARRYPGADDFVARRDAAEAAARQAPGAAGDVDLDEIYVRFAADAGPAWSADAIAFVREEEVALDRRTLRPRTVMMEALDHARRTGRRVVATSDSYLPRLAFDAVLAQHGIAVDAVYLSSERRARKDRGDLWPIVAGREQGEAGAPPRLLHVGDNEQSDIQQTADHGIRHFHILGPTALFEFHGLRPAGERTLGDDILLGPVAELLFNAPYLDPADPTLVLREPEQAGAVLFGPLVFAFVAWLARHPTVPHLRRLFFVSREGWFLRRLYDAVRDASGRMDLPPSSYLHCSRRAALAAAQGRGLDPDAVLRGAGFNGSLAAFLLARLGFVPDPALGHQHHLVSFPRDAELVRCAIALMGDEIAAHGAGALHAFTAYAEQVGLTGPGPLGFVDVGYSGTMQTAIQTALGQPLIGLYMGVSHDAAQVRAGGGHAFGAFADGNVADFTGGYGLMLEAFLTAPHGQVTGYDDGAVPAAPLFRHDGLSQRVFPILERIYDGVEEYALSLIRCWGPDLLDLPFRPEAATATLQAVRDRRVRLSPELMAVLSVEDDFCGNGEIAVFRHLGLDGAPAAP